MMNRAEQSESQEFSQGSGVAAEALSRRGAPDCGPASETDLGRGRVSRAIRASVSNGWLVAVAIVVAVFLVYIPCWHGGWLWDDQYHLIDNPVLKPGGLLKTWISPGRYINYWPATFTVYWIEYQLWGLQPLGFHLVNIGLHAASAVLLWRVLKRLRLPGGLLAAAIFALHPVNVEAVAWIAQLKTVLSMALALASVLFYLGYEQQQGRWRYALALAAFALSALSKGEAITLPIVLLALAWWQRGRITLRDALRVLPYFVIAAIMSASEVWSERSLGWGAVQSASIFGRAATAGCAVWFYLEKLVWPQNLIPIYPHWNIDAGRLLSYMPLLALLAAFAIAWWWRRSWGHAVVTVLVCYVAMLLPVLGFVNITYMKYSLVADHWQYVAMVVPIAAFTAWLAGFADRNVSRWLSAFGCAALLLTLSVLTWRQSGLYSDSVACFKETIARNPASWPAHMILGTALAHRNELDSAILEFQKAIDINPHDAELESFMAEALMHRPDRLDEAIALLERALELEPDRAVVHFNLGSALAREGKLEQAISQFERCLQLDPNQIGASYNLGMALKNLGQYDLAIARFEDELSKNPGVGLARDNLNGAIAEREKLAKAIKQRIEEVKRHPTNTAQMSEIAWVLATNPNASVRNGAESVELAQRAVKTTGGDDPQALVALAAAYAEVGRFNEAVPTGELAVHFASDKATADRYRGYLRWYKDGKPLRVFHDP
jgi:protein O-mannosyl-transferase